MRKSNNIIEHKNMWISNTFTFETVDNVIVYNNLDNAITDYIMWYVGLHTNWHKPMKLLVI